MATKTIVCDIDDTLIASGGKAISKTVDFINSHSEGYQIILVTARNESRRSQTIAELKAIGVKYNSLVMNSGSSAPGAARAYKKAAMQRILKNHDVVLAIDNSSQARSAYHSLGVRAIHPRDISSTSLSKSQWFGQFKPIGY